MKGCFHEVAARNLPVRFPPDSDMSASSLNVGFGSIRAAARMTEMGAHRTCAGALQISRGLSSGAQPAAIYGAVGVEGG